MSPSEPRTLVVGRVVKSHGVRGELVVEIRTDSPQLRFVPGAQLGVSRRGASHPETLTLAAVRPHAGRLLVCVEGVGDRESAEALRGASLTVREDELEEIDEPDVFHDHQLENLRVVDLAGTTLGRVREVLHSPASELLSVRTEDDREVLVPFVTAIVPSVDLAAGTVTVDPPEGLFDPA